MLQWDSASVLVSLSAILDLFGHIWTTHLANWKKVNISATEWPIVTNLTQWSNSVLQAPSANNISPIWKSKMVAAVILKNWKIAQYSCKLLCVHIDFSLSCPSTLAISLKVMQIWIPWLRKDKFFLYFSCNIMDPASCLHSLLSPPRSRTRLCFLKQFRRSGLSKTHLPQFSITVIRPKVEYCVPVWHYALRKAQSESIEGAQKRAIHIIYNPIRGILYHIISYFIRHSKMNNITVQ